MFCHLFRIFNNACALIPQPNGKSVRAMQRVSKTRSAAQKPHRDPDLCSRTQRLLNALIVMASPLPPYTSRGVSTAKLFSVILFNFFFFFTHVKMKWAFVKLCRMCFVPLEAVTPGDQSVAKLSFKRVWVSTLLNGLDSSPCMPDRLYIKLS